jgi:hypothetical protein
VLQYRQSRPDQDCDISEQASLAVLEAFVRTYLKSRIKTHRINSGLAPESSEHTAIRNLLKSFALHADHDRKIAVDPQYAMLVRVIQNMSSQFPREASSKGIVALFAPDHGITFSKVGSGYVVTGIPEKYPRGSVLATCASAIV